MYIKLAPLRKTSHGQLCLLPVTDYGFARAELMAPIVIDEIADVAREFPIVFPVGRSFPVALLGVEKDANAYIGGNGQWLANYIPAHIRQYPLALTRATADPQGSGDNSNPAVEDRFAVLIDVESAFVSEYGGEPLFNAEGSLAPAAQARVRIMEQMQNRAGITQRLVRAIDAAGLLLERHVRIQRQGQPGSQLTGIRVIDEAALNKLDDGAFNSLRKAGALPLIYASLLSWANFRQGPIGQSHPLPVAPVELDDDVIRFD